MEENNTNEVITEQPVVNQNNEINPIVEPVVTNQEIIEPVAPVEQQIVEPAPVEPENEVKTSGTADESELYIDTVKQDAEILDEYEIKKNISNEKKRYKRNTLFIVAITLLIVAFIVLLPFITKWIGY